MRQKKIELKGIGIKPLVEQHIIYFDDGCVKNLREYYLSLCKEVYRTKPIEGSLKKSSMPNIYGQAFCFSFNPLTREFVSMENYHSQPSRSMRFIETHIRISYLNGEGGFVEFLRGHEETHVLDFVEQRYLLEDRIAETYHKCLDLSSLDKELVANIGGIHALCRAGIDPQKVGFRDSNFDNALRYIL